MRLSSPLIVNTLLFFNLKKLLQINTIKEYLLYKLSEFSLSNDIEIDIAHPFSANILNSIDRNIILNVYELSNDNSAVDRGNIKGVIINLDKEEQKKIGSILETMVPKTIESLYIKNEFYNYSDFYEREDLGIYML